MNKERVMIFIDGSNFYHNTKKLKNKGYSINFNKLVNKLSENRTLSNSFYYTALLDKDYNLNQYDKHQRFINELRKIPSFSVVLCDLIKIKSKEGKFIYEIKGDDVHLAHDLLIGAFEDLYDVVIIVSGDADFIPVIKTIRKKYGKKIGNGYFRSSSSYKLRQVCNFSINMYKIINEIIDKQK
ncbi:MAG: NYN domain-containing protein [Nanoarchaeota archaeon]|nr:NYN domain-containing protein [Nanoarchaeota archaeon]